MPQPTVPAGPGDILWQAAHLLPRMAGTTVTGGDVVQALIATAERHLGSYEAAQAAADEAMSRLGAYLLVHCGCVSATLLEWLDGCATRTAAWAMKAAAEQ